MWKFGNLPNLKTLLTSTCKKKKMLAIMLCHALLSALGPWWFGWVWSHLLLPNPEWSPPSVFPQTHTHSNSDDDTPFQQLGSRPYEMGQCKSLFISRNILVPVSLFLFYIFLSIPQLLVCAIMAKIIILLKAEITVIWNSLCKTFCLLCFYYT